MAASAAPDLLPKLLPPPPPPPPRQSAAFLTVGDLPRRRQTGPRCTRAASLRHRCRAPLTRVSGRPERSPWNWLPPSAQSCPCVSASCTAPASTCLKLQPKHPSNSSNTEINNHRVENHRSTGQQKQVATALTNDCSPHFNNMQGEYV